MRLLQCMRTRLVLDSMHCLLAPSARTGRSVRELGVGCFHVRTRAGSAARLKPKEFMRIVLHALLKVLGAGDQLIHYMKEM